MNARFAAILVVLLVVLGGGALLYRAQEAGRRPQNAASLGQPLLKNLKAADVAALRFVEPKATLTLERKGEGWTVAERGGYPADVARVRDFVVKALELKVGQSEPLGEQDRARLNLDASGTQVEFRGADAKPLAAMVVGKKYFRGEVDDPAKARADGRFVALPGEPGTAYVVSDPLTEATARSSQWIDHASFQVEKVKTLEVRWPDGSGWKIERNADNADWKLAGAKPGEKLDVGRANAASYSLSLLEIADVAPADAKDHPEKSGLDKPILINATTLDGLGYAIRVGRLEGDNYYVSFSSSGTLAAKENDERIRKIAERMPRDRLQSEHVLLIAKSKLDDTLKPRAELIEKKPAAKK